MVANKPKPKQTGREPSLPSAKHRLRYDPLAVAKKKADRKAPLKSAGSASVKQSPGIIASGSSLRKPLPSMATAARPGQRHSQPVQRPSVLADMNRLSIGASQPASRSGGPAAAIGRAPADTTMDVDTKPDAVSSSGSASSSDSDSTSTSDSDQSDSAAAQGADLEREPLADNSDDEFVNKFYARSNSDSGRKPYKFRTTRFIEPVVRRWPVHRTKYTHDYERENIRIPAAHRTMQSLLFDRTDNVTRQIILRGDGLTNGYTLANPARRLETMPANAIQWPAIDFRRYKDHIQLNRHLPMGIDPKRGCRDLYTSVGLEEPCEEWDQQQIDFLYGKESAENDNVSLRESGYAHGFTAAADGSDISDTRRNGGMGIVVRRQQHGSTTGLVHTSDDVQFLTHLQIKYPGLAEPRLKRVPLLDAFEGRTPDVLSKYYLPVIDLTRTQVLGQVLKAETKSSGSHPPQLSKFASCSVAEEAVSGVSRIWDKMSDFWKHRLEVGPAYEICLLRGLLMPFPGSTKTGWLSVLEAASVADIPPEVIARCYHRLVKLCDVPLVKDEWKLSALYEASETVKRRQYTPHGGVKEEEEEEGYDYSVSHTALQGIPEEPNMSQFATPGIIDEANMSQFATQGILDEPNIVLTIDSDDSDLDE
ncbi:hypothetical protein H4S04_003322 [Coemansia sp. S16]|nr:hypothetical protein GGI14_003615 [Coemansia sp. S680]KAJ2029377.1 hypothetical protein H4S03_007438 [Coemansia sp. S3946]KAJ2049283.1 hypothetical protein H4S04_003322 [Coemansia sp. S16]KAJ2055515.1 hypothetical protein GGH13_007819 [Coemansia sp. S155-1]KAJ2098505.1 hypothetical protein GGI16_004261 [Coemansia sp. S142-1]